MPNAAHIDRVIASTKAQPKIWSEIWNAAWEEAWNAAYGTVYRAAWGDARNAAYDAARLAVYYNAVYYVAYNAARGSILALFVYNDSAKYLDMPSDRLKTWALLSEEPAAILLLPAVTAFEKISELELV